MVKQRKQTQRRGRQQNKKGGKRSGLVETAAVPFGLFAIQHVLSRKKKRNSSTKKRKTNKSYKNKSNRYYKK